MGMNPVQFYEFGKSRGLTPCQLFIKNAQITNETQKTAICKLVTDLIDANLWDKMSAIYPMVGGTALSHKFNLKDARDLNEAFRLIYSGVEITHSDNGIKFNNNKYANTNLIPSINLILNNTHLSAYCLTISTESNKIDMGAYTINTSPFIGLYVNWGGKIYSDMYANNATGRISVNVPTSIGFTSSSRLSSTSHAIYKNGVQLLHNTGLHSTLSLPAYPIFLGAVNNLPPYQTNREYSFFSVGEGLTLSENIAFYNIVQAFQTTLGRQV